MTVATKDKVADKPALKEKIIAYYSWAKEKLCSDEVKAFVFSWKGIGAGIVLLIFMLSMIALLATSSHQRHGSSKTPAMKTLRPAAMTNGFSGAMPAKRSEEASLSSIKARLKAVEAKTSAVLSNQQTIIRLLNRQKHKARVRAKLLGTHLDFDTGQYVADVSEAGAMKSLKIGDVFEHETITHIGDGEMRLQNGRTVKVSG